MRRLALFARSPVPGSVKTRLSPAYPERLASALYAALLADTVSAAEGCPVRERALFWADAAGSTPELWISKRQVGADLGARLATAFVELLTDGSDRAVIVGTDAPGLTSGHVAAAFDALETHDVALGPAADGGYWCIGLARRAPELFRDIPWSTDAVLARTLGRARASGLRVAMLTSLPDLDTPADLARLIGALAAGESACGTETRRALQQAGLLPG